MIHWSGACELVDTELTGYAGGGNPIGYSSVTTAYAACQGTYYDLSITINKN